MKKNKKDFLLGFAIGCFFLINAIPAWMGGEEFKQLMSASFLLHIFSNTDFLVYFIAINDSALFLLFTFWQGTRKWLSLWSIIYLLIVIAVTGIFNMDFIMHVAIISLIASYYLS
jgi:MFS superfamily sulfate permease-like transporter